MKENTQNQNFSLILNSIIFGFVQIISSNYKYLKSLKSFKKLKYHYLTRKLHTLKFQQNTDMACTQSPHRCTYIILNGKDYAIYAIL